MNAHTGKAHAQFPSLRGRISPWWRAWPAPLHFRKALHTLVPIKQASHEGYKGMFLSGSVLGLVSYLIFTMYNKAVVLFNHSAIPSLPSVPLETNSSCSETWLPSFPTVRREKRGSPSLSWTLTLKKGFQIEGGEATFTLLWIKPLGLTEAIPR